jgi:hypothetical protein
MQGNYGLNKNQSAYENRRGVAGMTKNKRNIDSIMVGWGEGASVYWVARGYKIVDCTVETTNGYQTHFLIMREDGTLYKEIIGLPVEVTYV